MRQKRPTAPQISQELAAFGTHISPAMLNGTMTLYAPHVLRAEEADCHVIRDCRYGEHERHRLDLFIPGKPRPSVLLLYVHGGGFVGGDKGDASSPFYGNVGSWAASQGWIGATMTYRLAPDHGFPAGAHDIQAAISWLRAEAGALGAPFSQIIVAGQSAGAAHVAMGLALARRNGERLADGVVLMSGIFDLQAFPFGPFEKAYYGENGDRKEQSSLAELQASGIPMLFTISEHDPEQFQRQARLVVDHWLDHRGRWPAMLYLPGENHLSPALGISLPESAAATHIIHFANRLQKNQDK